MSGAHSTEARSHQPAAESAAPLMLGVSGCRGILGKSLTPEVAARYAGAFGGWLQERAGSKPTGLPVTVVLARDGRAGGEAVRHAAVSGLIGAGCRVVDLGVAMTPTVGVMVDDLNAEGGMVLTASHNPQEWNGLKCIVRESANAHGVGAAAPTAAQANQIVDRFKQGKIGLAGWNAIGTLEHDHDAAERHVEKVLGALGQIAYIGDIRRCGFRVAVDSVNASGRVGAAALLDELGCDVAHLGDQTTGIFPHTPEPLRENLKELAAAVLEHGADIGFAQDPDADRLALIDEKGNYIGEEYTLVLAATTVLGAQRGAVAGAGRQSVAVNLSTSRMIDDAAAARNGTVLRTPVGEAHVVEAMRKSNAPIGGEGNGGVIWPAVTYIRDSLSSMALTLALLAGAVHGKRTRLSELVAQMPAYAIEKRKVDLASKELAKPGIEAIAKAYASEKIDRQDGVRVDFAAKRAWLHVRASNTEPIMRLIAEAPTADAARAILDEAAKVIAK